MDWVNYGMAGAVVLGAGLGYYHGISEPFPDGVNYKRNIPQINRLIFFWTLLILGVFAIILGLIDIPIWGNMTVSSIYIIFVASYLSVLGGTLVLSLNVCEIKDLEISDEGMFVKSMKPGGFTLQKS